MTSETTRPDPSSLLPKLHDENSISLASMLEYIQLPNHPMHQQAKERAERFIESERNRQIDVSRQAMQDQMEHISESEWSKIVD